jgi:hypothetical protein
MGNRHSKSSYKFDRVDFDKKIVILQDSLDFIQFYANELSNQVMPVSLSRYHNYNETTEEYFNSKRKESNIQLMNQNAKTRNLYDFYIQLTLLPKEYEDPNATETDKRNKIKLVLETATSINKILVSELTSNDLHETK